MWPSVCPRDGAAEACPRSVARELSDRVAESDVVLAKAIGPLTGIIERAQQRGEVRPGDPRLQAFSLMGAMMMGVIWHETLVPAGGEPLDIEALARQHVDTILAGLLVESGQ